jgi:hypothetical protein
VTIGGHGLAEQRREAEQRLLLLGFQVVLGWVSCWPSTIGSSSVDDAQDLLGRTTFVDKLYEQIVRLPSPHSFVFGLHAGWGEGKTSVLNLLQRRLKSDPTVIPVVFNPWYLATEAALIQSFYNIFGSCVTSVR